jgi:hypothetical protein
MKIPPPPPPPKQLDFGHFVLYNTDNYNPNITNTLQEIITKFSDIVIEYMRFISEKIKIKNKKHYIFIFERGIETLMHVFTMIFYYTKNLELTGYHTQKAFYFYIEFIEQISDDNITFLQLSSRDAIVFVYKKTIYDLNNEHKKMMPALTTEESQIIHVINSYMNIYKKITHFLIHRDFIFDNKNEYINSASNKVHTLSLLINKNKIKRPYDECINLFTKLLINELEQNHNHNPNENEICDFFVILEEFVHRIQSKKKALEECYIITKINDYYLDETVNLDNILEHIFT